MSLTPAGRRFLEHASRILEEVERLDGALLHAPDAPRGRLHVGAMEVFSIELLPQALIGLVDEHPAVVPCCHEMIPQRMVERLLGGDLDVAFAIGAAPVDGIELHSLGTSPGRLVCGLRHPLHRGGRITRADLQRYPSVVPRFLDAENLPSLDQFPDDRLPRRIGATIELLQMGVELAIRGSFLGFFPEISVRRHLQEGRLRALSGLSFGPSFKLHALTRGASAPKAAVRPLIERVRRLVRERKG